MDTLTVKTETSQFRSGLAQILAVMVKNFLMLSFGMNLGFPTILIGGITQSDSEFKDVTEDQISWLGSMSLLTVPIGSLLSGVVTQPLGRKRSMQFVTIPFVVSWTAFYFSTQLWHIYLALAFMGLFAGFVEAPFCAYVSEITEPHLRGILSGTGSMFAILGILTQFALGETSDMDSFVVKIEKSQFRSGLAQILAVMVKNSLMWSFGMSLGFPTILIGSTAQSDSEFKDVTEDQISWLGSISLLTVPIGSLLSGVVTQPLGRKRSMQFITIPLVVSWTSFYFATQMWHIYLALAFMGLFGGLVEAPSCTYVCEITEPHLRGILSSTGCMFVILGILTQFALGSFYKWRTCAIISSVLPITTFFLFLFVPESPYWLLFNHKDTQGKKALAWLRGWTTQLNVESELEDIIKQRTERKAPEMINCFDLQNLKPYCKKGFLWPFILITLLIISAQFTGVGALQTYAISIFTTLKVPINTYYATLFVSVSQVLGGFVLTVFIHVVGKRKLIFFSLTGACLCNGLIATYAHLNNICCMSFGENVEESNELSTSNWLPFVLLISLAFIAHCGVYLLPWIVMGELFSHETRAVGCGFSSAVFYLFYSISNKLYLSIISEITLFGTYIMYAGVCFSGILIMYFVFPETEGKPLEEIIKHFEGGSKLTTAVKRRKSSTVHRT